jgi:hypothetical protein
MPPASLSRAFISGAVAVAVGASLLFGEDPVAALSHRIDEGTVRLPFVSLYGYLPALLDLLHIPVQSQIAVFSKTSIQSLHIEPDNPRILFFNDSVSVGWVHGGFIELAAQDPGNGMRYYILQQRPGERLTRREDCMRCHQSGDMQLHSVTSTPDGIPSREIDMDTRTPFARLWGGWFVTGNAIPPGHLGNAVFAHAERREIVPGLEPNVALTRSSDVVALMVFTHQMHMMNLLAHPEKVNDLVDYLLFVDEPSLPGPVRGNSGFAEEFSAAGPRDRLGRSLRQFDLEKRLMRYPCSYMIYSDAFEALSPATKDDIYRRMWRILSGRETESRYGNLSKADRQAIVEILRDTKKDLPAWFGRQ